MILFCTISSLSGDACIHDILLQDYERNCLHAACTRISGALDVVKLLVRVMGTEAKLEEDKVSHCFCQTPTVLYTLYVEIGRMHSNLQSSIVITSDLL